MYCRWLLLGLLMCFGMVQTTVCMPKQPKKPLLFINCQTCPGKMHSMCPRDIKKIGQKIECLYCPKLVCAIHYDWHLNHKHEDQLSRKEVILKECQTCFKKISDTYFVYHGKKHEIKAAEVAVVAQTLRALQEIHE